MPINKNMKGFGEKKQSKKRKNNSIKKDIVNKNELLKKAFNLQAQGEKLEAAKYYAYLIKIGFQDYRVFSNYGTFLKESGNYRDAEFALRKSIKLNPQYANAYYNLSGIFIDQGNLLEAEKHLKKAIELNTNFAIAYYNLGFILKDLGRLKEAELNTEKAIEIDPNMTDGYLSLSTMPKTKNKNNWEKKLFSEEILKNKTRKELANIFFARSNILHREMKYKESTENLISGNNLKLKMYKSEANFIIKKTNKLKLFADSYQKDFKVLQNDPISIFIVGLPRCGSTLLESIISLNSQVKDLGEINIFEETFREYMKSNKKLNIGEIYKKKLLLIREKFNLTTNKWLFNYQYAGIIAKSVPNAKIIHCYRNPLDNILSIYRAHFSNGNFFSSSLIDCAEIYCDQENIMSEYKKEFKEEIYDLNYDKLVLSPTKEIKSLISWLNFEWDEKYLSPHLNNRKVLTRSNVEVRSPINSKSVGGWKNYKDLLKPSLEILNKNRINFE